MKPVPNDDLTATLARLRAFLDRRLRHLLVVEDDEALRTSIVELVGGSDIETLAVGTGKEALAALAERQFDCVVLDLGLPDMPGDELAMQIKGAAGAWNLPVVVYTGRELSRREEADLKRLTEAVIVKGEGSAERLLEETSLFLHRPHASLPDDKQRILERLSRQDPVLNGRKVLIVDDDVRNIFALTGALERQGMQVLYAENGRDGIALLSSTPDIHVVLMDVMMPEMDGYQTMQAIRQMPRFQGLPMIALTAKAMRGDREKCLAAGASDYITKPVDMEQLLSLLRVWLSR
jgi:hypothetical protein